MTSGDEPNNLFDPTGRAILAHPSIVTDAQQKADGTPDARVERKIAPLDAPRTVQGITTDVIFNDLSVEHRSHPDHQERGADPAARRGPLLDRRCGRRARRHQSHPYHLGWAARARGAFTGDEDFVTELLYNRRYSLLFEGGHRWIDARRFGRLDMLPLALPTHTVQARFPFPEAECLARTQQPAQGCTLGGGS